MRESFCEVLLQYYPKISTWIQKNDPGCITYMAFDIVVGLFSAASFCGVVALSVDRFLAIHLHLRYQELVTHKRVVCCCCGDLNMGVKCISFFAFLWNATQN